MELEFQNATIGPLKRHYRAILDFEIIEFQKSDISLISLENGATCKIIFLKKV